MNSTLFGIYKISFSTQKVHFNMEEHDTSVSINPTTVTVYGVIYYVLTVINFIVTPTYMYVVIFKSKDTMKSFKNLLIAGMPFLIYSTTFISITIPIYAYKICNYQFHGVIKGVSLATNVAMTTALDICDQMNADLMLVMLINRYQIISANFIEHSKFLYPAIYAFLALTNVLQSAILIVKLVLEPIMPSLENSFITNINFFIISTGLILLSRIYAHLKIVFLNRSFATKVKPVITPATLQLHTMLFRAVLSNVFVTIVSKLLYMTLVIGILVDQSSLDILINIVTMFHNISYICEMVITLYFVKPYREFIASFFRRSVEVPIAAFRSNTFQISFH
uniref:Serpentine Receptor, class Z n=1 Tax=Panagrellus redivivus TaxID=6233 RepID=A0A7E4W5B2_PANRE